MNIWNIGHLQWCLCPKEGLGCPQVGKKNKIKMLFPSGLGQKTSKAAANNPELLPGFVNSGGLGKGSQGAGIPERDDGEAGGNWEWFHVGTAPVSLQEEPLQGSPENQGKPGQRGKTPNPGQREKTPKRENLKPRTERENSKRQ